jgi:hypothetical protein
LAGFTFWIIKSASLSEWFIEVIVDISFRLTIA